MDNQLILLIDDDPMSSTYSSLIVKKLHPKVNLLSFQSGIDALSYLQNQNNPKPNIILLDINMPVMNGWDFMEEFQQLSLPIEVIIITSSNEPSDKEKCRTYKGISDLFIKPLSVENVKNLFEKVKA